MTLAKLLSQQAQEKSNTNLRLGDSRLATRNSRVSSDPGGERPCPARLLILSSSHKQSHFKVQILKISLFVSSIFHVSFEFVRCCLLFFYFYLIVSLLYHSPSHCFAPVQCTSSDYQVLNFILLYDNSVTFPVTCKCFLLFPRKKPSFLFVKLCFFFLFSFFLGNHLSQNYDYK